MQVSKFLLTVCTTVVCAGVISIHAQDTPAQAAARAALMAAMNGQSAPVEQLQNAPVAVESPGVTAPQTNVIATPEPAPTTVAPPAVVAPVAQPLATVPPPADTEAQAAARAALLQAMNQAPVATTPAPAVTTMPAPIAASPAPAKPVAPEAKPAPASPAMASSAGSPAKESGFAPMVAPPLPISADQELRLQALNAQYFANQISPQEYFKQREAILKGQ
jgi:hypothetical protein